MSNNFTYYLLNYIHSQFLNERVNVGILFHFENTNQFIFKYPKKYKRLRDLYGDFSEWQLRANLAAIERKTFNLSAREIPLFGKNEIKDIEVYFNKRLLREDSTVLQFSGTKYSTNTTDSISTIINNYYNLYFSEYKEDKIIRDKHDELYIENVFRQKLISRKPGVQNHLYRNVTIKAPQTSVEFEYKWKNGVDNYVKTIAFDLEGEDSINHKAILLFAQLNFIESKINDNKVDLLVSKPSINRKDLKEAYAKGVRILHNSSIKPSIYDEDNVGVYIEKLISEISTH